MQKNMIVGIVLLVIVICLILVAVIPNDKAKNVSSKKIENEEELQEVILNEEIIEYVDINELAQNTIVEENPVENTEKNNTTNKTTTGTTPYYIKVNYGAQVVTIYKKDSAGNYTVPVKAIVCSTGVYTPKSGVYKIPSRYRWLGLQGDVYGQYCTQVVGNILFHSVPYLERGNPGSLEYWEYDKLGTYASAGCIRLTVADAMWIYNNCAKGTQVEFYSSSDPGPLGKPSAKKISNAEGNLKNWDPTDPDANNPWKNYKQEENNNTNTETNNNVNSNNTQTNENTNTQNNIIKENEIVNEVNTNTINSNEISKNETANEIYTNNIKANEVQIDDKVNKEVVSNEESLNTNITL